jgi:hypothetical protein
MASKCGRKGGKSGMIYIKSTFAGLVCVCVASLLISSIISAYLSVVYHVGTGPIGWNSSFFASPFDWLFTTAVFSGGFFWEFRRSRSKSCQYPLQRTRSTAFPFFMTTIQGLSLRKNASWLLVAISARPTFPRVKTPGVK